MKRKIDNKRGCSVMKGRYDSNVSERVASFAEDVAGLPESMTAYSKQGGQFVLENPFDNFPEGGPFILNASSFVYWAFYQVGCPLNQHVLSIRQLPHSDKLKEIASIGSNYPIENLLRGDLVFFAQDRHVGIYVGNNEFVSCMGSGENNFSGGVVKEDITKGIYLNTFEGHVMSVR